MSEEKKWWIKEHPVGRNISNQHKVYTAVDVPPQNPGWTCVIEHADYAALKKENAELRAAIADNPAGERIFKLQAELAAEKERRNSLVARFRKAQSKWQQERDQARVDDAKTQKALEYVRGLLDEVTLERDRLRMIIINEAT